MYIQTKLLYSCVKDENEILAEFIEKCGDKLLENGFIFKSAKGGNFALQRKIDGFDTSRYEYDQNMYSHIFNGFFPTYDLLKVLEEKEIIVLKDLEKKIYTLGYLLHDIDKIWGKELKIDTKENIEIFKTDLFDYYLKLGADSFLPEIKEYIGDLAFLIVNTQKSRGTNLDQRNFSTKLNDRSLVFIRKLCTYSDKITYLIKSPSDILDSSINKEVEDITEGSFKLFFHKLPEVRGLISNVINNALIKIYEEENFIPYLFFSDGVVYIGKTNQIEPKLDIDNVFEKVKNSLGKLCGDNIKRNYLGFTFGHQNIASAPKYYFDFISIKDYFNIVKKKALTPATDASINVLNHFSKIIDPKYKNFTYIPDNRICSLARFLIFLEDQVYNFIENKNQFYIDIFDLLEIPNSLTTDLIELKKSIKSSGSNITGGIKTEWFYISAIFLEKHKGISILKSDENDYSVELFLEKLIEYIFEKYENEINKNDSFKGIYLETLKQYVEDLNVTKNTGIFLNELDRYTNSKKIKKNENVCSICSSSYPTNIQDDSSLPFQSSTFKNKILVFKGGESGAGSICSICSIEFMLRQILTKDGRSGKKFEGIKAKYFYVYPNYFFTNSTQKFVRKILDYSKNINIFDLIKSFKKAILNNESILNSFLDSEENLVGIEIESKDTSFLKIDFPEKENMNLIMSSIKGGDTDTESWTIPTLLAFFYFIMLNSKVVLTDSLIPLYNSQYEIKDSIIFDSPHNSIQNILKKQSFNIDEIYDSLVKLMTCYSIHIDTYSDGGRKPNWNQFNEISRGINTDLFEIFKFMEIKLRKDKRNLNIEQAKTYLKYLDILGGNKEMSIIKNTVQRYAIFYSAKGWSSYGITRPVRVITDMLLKTDPETLAMEDDMKLFLIGELRRWVGAVIGRSAKGYILIRGKELNDCLNDFTEYFYDEIFKKYCKSDISLLRNRLNGFLGGCEAYYVANYKIEQSEEEDENA